MKRDMKRLVSYILALVLVLGLCACGQKAEEAPTWQEQYDLGIRYLSEGNYSEAIIAFTAAIEIDPKQADVYLKLAEAHSLSGDNSTAKSVLEQAITVIGETDDLLSALEASIFAAWQEQYDLGMQYLAAGNYEEAILAFTAAIDIDPKQADAYIGKAEAYIGQNDVDKAINVLEEGILSCGESSALLTKLDEIHSAKRGEFSTYYTSDLILPQEMSVNNTPFWQASLEDVEAVYPGGRVIPAGDIPVPQYDAPVYGADGMRYGCCYAGYNEETMMLTQVVYDSYLQDGIAGFTTELRGICAGQSLLEVFLSLGLTEQAAEVVAVASNSVAYVNSQGVLSMFECFGDNSNSYQEFALDFQMDGFMVRLGLTFEDGILKIIRYYYWLI